MKYMIAAITAMFALLSVSASANAWNPDAPNPARCYVALRHAPITFSGTIRADCGLEEDQFADVWLTLRGLTPPANGAFVFGFAESWLLRNRMANEACTVETPILDYGTLTLPSARAYMRSIGVDPYNVPFGFDIICADRLPLDR